MYLLDTHIALWWLESPEKLTDAQTEVLQDTQTVIFLSAASVWEITIKSKLGKLGLSANFWETLDQQKFTSLPITVEHARSVSELPPLHQDPFDRILLAQAHCERATLLTQDKRILQYDIPTL